MSYYFVASTAPIGEWERGDLKISEYVERVVISNGKQFIQLNSLRELDRLILQFKHDKLKAQISKRKRLTLAAVTPPPDQGAEKG